MKITESGDYFYMPRLEDFPTARQNSENSCWACASRSIINWYEKSPKYSSDQELAAAWNTAKPGQNHNNINIQQSAVAALEDLGYETGADERAIPKADEIKEQIEKGQPLLAIVGESQLPSGEQRNLNYQQGHWVVIIGISSDLSTIEVFDPAEGSIQPVAYNKDTYKSKVYWQNTSYVDPK
jgi:papain like cysteine protease AvrRpt2